MEGVLFNNFIPSLSATAGAALTWPEIKAATVIMKRVKLILKSIFARKGLLLVDMR